MIFKRFIAYNNLTIVSILTRLIQSCRFIIFAGLEREYNETGNPAMPVDIRPQDISVLFLYNMDPGWSPQELKEINELTCKTYESFCSAGYTVVKLPVTGDNLPEVLSNYNPIEHIVFNWCECLPGIFHSEWLVADYLEKGNFTFTGAASDVLAKTQDKKLIKKLLDDSGICTPYWQIYDTDSPVNWERFPAIVKPSMEHCSEGIDRNAICLNKEELLNRISFVNHTFKQPALVEDFIDGRELHVSLWGNGHIEMLPPAEMDFSMLTDRRERLCGYEAKFVPGSVQYESIRTLLPAPLTEEELLKVEQACKAAYKVTGCRDYGRIDLRMKDGFVYILDVNPNSDISPDTSTILSAEIEGYNYERFIDRIIRLAAHRHPVWGR